MSEAAAPARVRQDEPHQDAAPPGEPPRVEAPAAPALAALAPLAGAAALAACGGGGGGGSAGGAAAPPGPNQAAVSAAQASRFLHQATFGATAADIARVQTLGYDAWITEQAGLSRTSHWDWLVANGYGASTFINNTAGFDNTVWRQIISEPGQLRQRVGMALSEIMVIGVDGLNLNWKQFNGAAWLDVLLDNALGNFRTLLEQITYLPAMASYLTYLNNRRANAATGSVPDENYAREVMQLFSLGLFLLRPDGTPTTVPPTETYTQNDVSQLARVFTGMSLDSTLNTTPDRYRRRLVFNNALRENGASSFLGATVPAGSDGETAIRIALDAIFNHPNVPPFISRQLIQRLVTSNPSPAYVARVSAVFANNGQGVRGDLLATVRAILLDAEARGDAALTAANAGKLREPVVRLANWARAFGATSTGGLWPIGDTSSTTQRLGQSYGRSASVFNFFRPGYTPPNTAIAAAELVAPEFQITNELTVVAYVNYIRGAIQNGLGADVRANYAAMQALAADGDALVDQVNLLLAANQLSPATLGAIRGVVNGVAASAPLNRVYLAILLTMAAPEYITQR